MDSLKVGMCGFALLASFSLVTRLSQESMQRLVKGCVLAAQCQDPVEHEIPVCSYVLSTDLASIPESS